MLLLGSFIRPVWKKNLVIFGKRVWQKCNIRKKWTFLGMVGLTEYQVHWHENDGLLPKTSPRSPQEFKVPVKCASSTARDRKVQNKFTCVIESKSRGGSPGPDQGSSGKSAGPRLWSQASPPAFPGDRVAFCSKMALGAPCFRQQEAGRLKRQVGPHLPFEDDVLDVLGLMARIQCMSTPMRDAGTFFRWIVRCPLQLQPWANCSLPGPHLS